jgi:starch-binding outer membrane protein, SusD/RagB family
MKRENIVKILLPGIPLLCGCLSCTKLDTKVYDQVTNFWRTPDQIAAGVAPAYSGLRNYAPANSIYSLNEVSTDEIILPDRLTDWNDQAVWRDLWKHTWGPNHQFVQDGWQFIYGGIARVNLILQTLNKLNPKPVDISFIEAELKTIRAFYYYMAIDLYGNVPIHEVGIIEPAKLGTKTRKVVFAYVEKELKDNLPALTSDVNSKTYGRATKWFGEALLAKLYLNAQVFTDTPRWADCIVACDAILNANKYSLEPNFFNNFLVANEGSKENIFVIPFDINAGLYPFWLQAATLHYNSNETFGLQFFPGGFNGYCSTAEYYNLFEPTDKRRKMFLVGQQYKNQDSTNPANIQYDRSGNPLIFDPVITTFKIQPPKTETAGARCAKWEFNKQGGGIMTNDFAVYRLADIILMKAEAQFRNGDNAAALTTINQKSIPGVSIRSRAGLPDFSSAEMTLNGLLKERANELSWEGWRRNDLIRYGHYTDARIPEKAISDSFRILYPIPQAELSKNPYLVQNRGY